jgi:hypothetical protein
MGSRTAGEMRKTGNWKFDLRNRIRSVDEENFGRGDREGETDRPLSDDWCRRNAEARQE